MRTIIEMVNLTRLDCAIASAGQMRIALSQALNHIRNRSVFQRVSSTSRRCAPSSPTWRSNSRRRSPWCSASPTPSTARRTDPREAAYARLLTPAVKFLVCKSTPQLVYEALECLGGNGYTEDLPMARYYREAPLNAIWEGSGNVMALDVLRAAGRHPEARHGRRSSRLVRTASRRSTSAAGAALGGRCNRPTPNAARASCARAWPGSPPSRRWSRRSRHSPRSTATRGSAGAFGQFGTADLGDAGQALMDRALAAA